MCLCKFLAHVRHRRNGSQRLAGHQVDNGMSDGAEPTRCLPIHLLVMVEG